MVAVILAAGKGTRLQSIYACSSKCLIPINGITVIGRKVKLLAQSKYVEKIIIVIREEQVEIPKVIGNQCNNVPITYSYQAAGKNGLVSALYSIEEIYDLCDTEVLINLGDEYYENLDYDDFVDRYKKSNLAVSPVIIQTSNEELIRENYTVKLKDDLSIVNVIEKPKKVFNRYIGCGTILISSELLIHFSDVYQKQFEGVELIDWIKFAMINQLRCCAYEAYGEYANLNRVTDLERIYQIGRNIRDKMCDSGYCYNSFDNNAKKAVLLGRPNDFSRVYVLDSEKKILGYEQIGDLWLWKKEFASPETVDQYRMYHEVEKDVINSSQYMIRLGIRGLVKTNGLYYQVPPN